MLIVETSISAALAIFFTIFTIVLYRKGLLLIGYYALSPIIAIFFAALAIFYFNKPTPKSPDVQIV